MGNFLRCFRAGVETIFSRSKEHSNRQNHSIMKTVKFITTLIGIAVLSGCGTGPDAQTGTVLGGLGGAAVGGIIGNQSGRGLEGAAIGGGIGAVAGNLLGNARDQRNNQ